jgi:hypothetical protein
MAIVSVVERADVSASRRFGEAPKFQRKWVVEVDDPTTPQTFIVNSCGVRFLDQHPEAYYCRAMNTSVGNYSGSRFHYEVTWDYELPRQSEADLDPNPLARRDIWRWSTGGLTVPALYYYDSGTLKALVNSAQEFLEGATTDISTLQAAISANRATFDYSLAQAVTNSVNSDTYLGSAAHTWKCSGISGQPAVEVVNEVEIRYWQIETTLEFRPDGWDLQLPDVGWNYLEGSTKERVWVLDSETKERVPSSNPQPLNTDGTLKTGAPDILVRQVQREVAFATFFGTPPS